MAKVRLVAVVLLLATMLLSVGFAKTQKLPIEGTVETGALNVDIEGTTIEYSNHLVGQKSVSADGHSVSFTVDRLYPGAEIAMHIKVVNTGTISAAFDNASLTWEGNFSLKPYLEALSGFQYDDNGNGRIDGGANLQSSWTNLDPIPTIMNDSIPLRSMVLGPNGAFYLGTPVDGVQGGLDCPFKIRLSENTPNEMQTTSVTFKLILNWKQAIGEGWTGPVAVVWYKVPDNNGWDVFGDVYMLKQDGTLCDEPYRERAVKDHFSGNENVDHKIGNFWVQSNHYQVKVPKEPPADPEIVQPKKD